MKVLVWSDGVLTYGAGQQAALLAQGLATRGHLVTMAHRGDHPAELTAPLEQIVLSPDDLWEPAPRGPCDDTEADEVLTRTAPDVVVVNDTCPIANLALKQQLVNRGLPWVAVEHLITNPPRLDGPLWRERAEALLAQAQSVVAVSASLRDELAAQYRGLPVAVVVPNGRPDQYFEAGNGTGRAQTRHDLGVADDSLLVLVVARVEESKGTLVLARAMEMLATTPWWPNLRIRWAGDGTQRSRLTGLTRLRRWEPQLAMLGVRDDVVSLLQAADVFLQPTYVEGMPLAVIEAMAAGLVVVGSDIPAMREVMGSTGLTVPDPGVDHRRTAECVVECLTRLWSHPGERRELGRQARQFADAQYRSSAMVDRYEDLVLAAVGRS